MSARLPANHDSDPIDALVNHVCDQLIEPLELEPSSLGRSVFARKLRQAILNPVLSGTEQEIVDGLVSESQPADMDRLLTARIKLALETACEATGLDSSELAQRLARSVVVARGDGARATTSAAEGLDALGTLTLTQTIHEDSMAAGEPPHVFTNRGGQLEIEQTKDVQVDDRSRLLSESLSIGTESIDAESMASEAVFEMTGALEALEEHVLEAAPEHAKAKLESVARGDDLIDKTLNGKYLITGRLGKGGFGTVYQAIDLGFAEELGEASGAKVAIKVLNSNIQGSKKAIKSFLAEANRLTLLSHPNIVQWMTFDKTSEGIHYFVMEFLEGRELADILKEEKQLDPMRVGKIMLDVLAALQCAHEVPDGRALLHLDLKPQNVFILGAAERGAETAKVIDFGIGQNVSNEFADVGQTKDDTIQDEALMERTIYPAPRGGTVEPDAEDASPTRRRADSSEGKVRRAKGGTVLYASPEQCKHLRKDDDIENLDGRSDIYSLGVVGFKALTGTYPFAKKATSLKEAYRQHLAEPARKVRDVRPKVPRRLAAVIDRCLEKDKERRFQSAAEARVALERAMQPLVSKSFMIAVPVMLLPIIGFSLHAIFKAPDYDQINYVEVERTRAKADADPGPGEAPGESRRMDSLGGFSGNQALYLALDNGGDKATLAFVGKPAPTGKPELFRGESPADPDARPLAEVILKELDGSYVFHVLGDEPLPRTDVFVRWPDALKATPPFRLTTTAALPKAPVDFRLKGSEGAGSKLDVAEDYAVWTGTTQRMEAEVYGDLSRVAKIGLKDLESGQRLKLVPLLSADQAVVAVRPKDLLAIGDADDDSGYRELQVILEDRAGRVVPMGETLHLWCSPNLTTIEPSSVSIHRIVKGNAQVLTPMPLRPGQRERVWLTDEVERIQVSGRLSYGARPRTVELELRGLGQTQTSEVTNGRFAFTVGRDDLQGDAASQTFRLRLAVLDAGLLPKGEGASSPWVTNVSFPSIDKTAAVGVLGARGQRQELPDQSAAYVMGGRTTILLPKAQGSSHFGLYRVTEEASAGELVGAALGAPAADQRSIEFRIEADPGEEVNYELRQFESGSLALKSEDGKPGEADLLAALRDPSCPEPIVVSPLVIHVVNAIAIEQCGFETGDEVRLDQSKVTAEMLPDLVVQLAEPESLRLIRVMLRSNGDSVMTAELVGSSLMNERRDDAWILQPEVWANTTLNNAQWEDGRYDVVVALEDKAGNLSAQEAGSFSVAAQLPVMRKLAVSAAGFEAVSARCRLIDANGLAWPPSATLEVDGEEWPMPLVSERPEGEPIQEAEVRFALPLDRAWSRKPAKVKVVAAKAGSPTMMIMREVPLDIGRVRPAMPSTLSAAKGLKGSTMRLVRGPGSSDDYVFAEGGGSPSGELLAKMRATEVPYLVDYSAYRRYLDRQATFFPTEKSIEIPPDDLLDYYLDETEVTQAQFLEFVEANDGYAEILNWPFLSSIAETPTAKKIIARRSQWLGLRQATDRETTPVSGVLWEEAMAYARWAGKRLPTLLEWEYAVRGEQGRIFASDPTDRTDGARAYLTKQGEFDAVNDPEYRSPEGLYHLCGNVAEWTETPYWTSLPMLPFRSDSAAFCAHHVNGGMTLDDLLEDFSTERDGVYGSSGPLFFVVGAGWARQGGKWGGKWTGYNLVMPPHDYRVVDRLQLRDSWQLAPSAPRVGFRCAKSAR